MNNSIQTSAIAALLLLAASTNVQAQYSGEGSIEALRLKNERNEARNQLIWGKRSSPFLIYRGTHNTLEQEGSGTKMETNFAYGIASRTTFSLHKKPIGNFMKIGLEVTWLELGITRYEKGTNLVKSNIMGNVSSGTFNSFDDYFNAADQAALDVDNDGNIGHLLNLYDVGKWQFDISMGIGPNIRIVPLYFLDKPAWDKLKLSFYYHYVPTYTGLMLSSTTEDGATLSFGIMNRHRIGYAITYGRFGIGVEHVFGKGKLENMDYDDDPEWVRDEFNITQKRTSYTVSSSRVYFGFHF